MSEQNWKTIINKNEKKLKVPEPVKFDPIPARQRETLNVIKEQENANKQVKYSTQTNTNQDWTTVTLNKIQVKPKITQTQNIPSAIKLDESDNVVKIKCVSSQMARAIIDARISKKWSQVQLAHNSCVDIKTINEIEKSGCIYNSDVFNKVSKALGIKIDRNCDFV